MGRQHVGHAEIAQFADERVNLKREDATESARAGEPAAGAPGGIP